MLALSEKAEHPEHPEHPNVSRLLHNQTVEPDGSRYATVGEAVLAAERLLPGVPRPEPADDASPDPRWQAIIEVGYFIDSNPEEVWAFAAKWGCSGDEDLRGAIATCLVEHLVEAHFATLFPRLKELALLNEQFAGVVASCWSSFDNPAHREEFEELRRLCSVSHPPPS